MTARPPVDFDDLELDMASETESETEQGLAVGDLSGFVTIYRIGRERLDLRTNEGREVRITAKQDVRTGKYRAAYERRTIVKNDDGVLVQVWTPTPVYGPMISADPETCLRRAAEDVAKLRVY
jgi:hypothetical protein